MKASWVDRLFAKCEWRENGCREWTGYQDSNGYGQMYRKPKLELTHRLAWEAANGPIPEGKVVCHSCDNPACCYSPHLFLGTQLDNIADMNFKGRHAKGANVNAAHGSQHPKAKLSEKDVLKIRSRMLHGETPAVVARDFGISRRQASNIRSGKQWRHVEILMGAK